MEKENILFELIENIKDDKFIKIVFSDEQGGDFNKIIIKPLFLKSEKNIQIESFKENKAFHKNIELNNIQEIEAILKEYIENFKQILLQIENLDIAFIKKKETFVKRENKNNLIKNSNEHNKKKQYILNEGDKIDFLIELGLMSVFYNTLKIMADNGVVLDKFATLATDSFRSLTLELCGYKTKMIEFIDTEHTPKNILIKAIKSKSSNLKEKLKEYNKLKEFLGIHPLLEDLTKKFFLIDTNTEIPYN